MDETVRIQIDTLNRLRVAERLLFELLRSTSDDLSHGRAWTPIELALKRAFAQGAPGCDWYDVALNLAADKLTDKSRKRVGRMLCAVAPVNRPDMLRRFRIDGE